MSSKLPRENNSRDGMCFNGKLYDVVSFDGYGFGYVDGNGRDKNNPGGHKSDFISR